MVVRRMAIAASLGLSIALAACGKGEAPPPAAAGASASTPAPSAGPSAPAPSAGGLSEAAQQQMIPALEQTYKSRNAKARMEGKVMHVRMDGDASVPNAGWTDCRVISQLIRKEETAVLEFPNGTVDCEALFKKVLN